MPHAGALSVKGERRLGRGWIVQSHPDLCMQGRRRSLTGPNERMQPRSTVVRTAEGNESWTLLALCGALQNPIILSRIFNRPSTRNIDGLDMGLLGTCSFVLAQASARNHADLDQSWLSARSPDPLTLQGPPESLQGSPDPESRVLS